jgi:hypothetical protein
VNLKVIFDTDIDIRISHKNIIILSTGYFNKKLLDKLYIIEKKVYLIMNSKNPTWMKKNIIKENAIKKTFLNNLLILMKKIKVKILLLLKSAFY